MSKLMRRCGSFLMMLLLVIGILPMTANAETTQNTEERNALYVQVPEDWENPCVWAWDSDGNNAFTAWPGEEMEADTANDGWYYIWLPAWANHVIVNAELLHFFFIISAEKQNIYHKVCFIVKYILGKGHSTCSFSVISKKISVSSSEPNCFSFD